MNKRTALHVLLCAWLVAMTYCPDRPLAQAADAADPLTAAVDQPPAAAPSPPPGKRGAAGRVSEDAAAAVPPPAAERQTESERPRLRGLGKPRYPREEPDVGFGGPSRAHDAAREEAR